MLLILVLIVACCAAKWYYDYKKSFFDEEKVVYAVSPEYLSAYKRQCLEEGGISFCAKRISDDDYVGANPYSDTLDTAKYLLTCRKKKASKSEPECLTVP
ncbi:MAG TPA: hypothetical protein ENK93_04260 [Campylobacteraceae bacterium]|nr:hypothetical protein [Campylobacteraceae bacterium]